jgi:hypothetical protein
MTVQSRVVVRKCALGGYDVYLLRREVGEPWQVWRPANGLDCAAYFGKPARFVEERQQRLELEPLGPASFHVDEFESSTYA